jgi:hypothetical protein
MPAYPYKSQVQIVVALMTLNNYIRMKSQENVAFTEYGRNPNFIPDDFLPNVVPRSQNQGIQKPSQMDYVRDGIKNSLIR